MYRSYVPRYAHYVLLRAQCFAGMFTEIALEETEQRPARSEGKKGQQRQPSAEQKPITSTALRPEHLEAAKLLTKAGCACAPNDGEDCENIALAAERVAVDMMSLTSAVAVALNRAIKGKEAKDADPEIVKRWCEFYSVELLPQTKAMVKKTSPKLDAYGLFLPTRMTASVSQEVLKKGLQGAAEKEDEKEVEISQSGAKDEEASGAVESKKEAEGTAEAEENEERDEEEEKEEEAEEKVQQKEDSKKEEAEEEEEYEYEEEYYDEE